MYCFTLPDSTGKLEQRLHPSLGERPNICPVLVANTGFLSFQKNSTGQTLPSTSFKCFLFPLSCWTIWGSFEPKNHWKGSM